MPGYINPNSCQWEGRLCFLQPAKPTFLALSAVWRCLCSTSFVYKAVLVRFTNSSPVSHPSVSSCGSDPSSLPRMAKFNEINKEIASIKAASGSCWCWAGNSNTSPGGIWLLCTCYSPCCCKKPPKEKGRNSKHPEQAGLGHGKQRLWTINR